MRNALAAAFTLAAEIQHALVPNFEGDDTRGRFVAGAAKRHANPDSGADTATPSLASAAEAACAKAEAET